MGEEIAIFAHLMKIDNCSSQVAHHYIAWQLTKLTDNEFLITVG